jgi:hypothetical protein
MITSGKYADYKPEKDVEKVWDSFRRGLNALLRDTELQDEELKTTQNVIIEGKGILKPRPGTADYFQASSSSVAVRALTGIEFADGTNELLAITDEGYLVKKNGVSSTMITGSSFPSGYPSELVQIWNNIYIVNPQKEMCRYDGTDITEYVGIDSPTGLTATKSTGTTGTMTYSWRVSAESEVGETLASTAVQLSALPEELTSSNYVTLSWSAVSAASGVLKGYVLYGRVPGDETFLTRVSDDVTSYIDDGTNAPSDIAYLPESDTTPGPKAKYVVVHKQKLILANINGYPSRVMWSGGGPYIDEFHWGSGGGSVDIDRDNGEQITGIIESSEGSLIVFKERSIYQLTLSYNSSLGIVEPTVSRLSSSIGCVSHRTIKMVENAIFFAGRRAGGGVSLNSLDYEPNILSATLRTSEISARIRPLLESVEESRFSEMSAEYFGNRYYWFLPIGGGSVTRCVTYDRERLAFTGWHTYPNYPSVATVYFDSSDEDHFVYGDGDDGYVTEISSAYNTDKGTQFSTKITLPREVFKDAYRLKILKDVFVDFRNVMGTVNVNVIIEKSDGLSTTAKSFSLGGRNSLAGWGAFAWAGPYNGISPQYAYNPSTEESAAAEAIKYATLYKANIRSAQIEITGTGVEYEFLGAKLSASLMGKFYIPSAYRVS